MQLRQGVTVLECYCPDHPGNNPVLLPDGRKQPNDGNERQFG